MTISTLQFQVPTAPLSEVQDRANELFSAGDLKQAERLCQHLLIRQPGYPPALHLMGMLASAAGEAELAVRLIRESIAAAPAEPIYHNNLSVVLYDQGHHAEAASSAREALRLAPDFAEAENNLGRALYGLGEYEASAAHSRQALALKPNYAHAYLNLANACSDLGQLSEALVFFDRALALDPDRIDAYLDKGAALRESGLLDESITCLQEALRRDPAYRMTHFSLALSYLLKGDLRRGLEVYEWRKERARMTNLPEWNGSDLRGRTVFLPIEQGFGDTLQFVRYVPQVLALGAKVIVGCQFDLRRLFRANLPDCLVISNLRELPHADFEYPLLSLPYALGTTLETIPAAVPYLRADLSLKAKWRQRTTDERRLKVGLVWAGSKVHKKDRERSLKFADLAPLWAVEGVAFYSLQKGPAAQDAAGSPLIDFTAEFTDFAESAAFVDSLDMVIAVDTAAVHLAGALGKPVWAMLSFMPDWRWLLDRSNSPWYPTVRLFRQRQRGAWGEVLAAVTESLRDLAKKRLSSS